MTRIAIFTDADPDGTAGLTTILKAVRQYAPPDVHARVFTASDFSTDTREYFAAASVALPMPWDRRHRVFWPRVRPFARQLRATGTDVIHVATAGPVGLAGRWLARRLGVPVVGSVHAPVGAARERMGVSAPIGKLIDRLTCWAYDGCDPILVSSRETGVWLETRGLPHTQTWQTGVDSDRFTPARSSSALRQMWHVDHRRPAILLPIRWLTDSEIASIEPIRRGLHRHALAHQFVFVGHVRSDVRDRHPDAVFIDDPMDDERAVAMASTDLCLFPGVTDAVDGMFLEAQSCGLPVVVPNRGGAMEHIVDGRTGCLTKAHDVDDIVSCVAGLLRSAARRAAPTWARPRGRTRSSTTGRQCWCRS